MKENFDTTNAEKLFLCRPCAEKLKDFSSVKHIKIGAPRKKKGTCEQCCRRRFGYDCDVVFKEV